MKPRQHYAQLNERFDVKHVVHDLRSAGVPDPILYELAVKTGRIILTQNARDFEDLVSQKDCGLINIPPHWYPKTIDTKLLALLRRHSPRFFHGRLVSLGVPVATVRLGGESPRAARVRRIARGKVQASVSACCSRIGRSRSLGRLLPMSDEEREAARLRIEYLAREYIRRTSSRRHRLHPFEHELLYGLKELQNAYRFWTSFGHPAATLTTR